MNQEASAKDTAAADNKLNGSDDSTELFQAEQLDEYKRILKMSRFIRIKDDLDVALKEITDTMLEASRSIDKADFEYSYISDMSLGLPSAESLLKPDFFDRTTLIFWLLRRALDLHLVNNTTMDYVHAIQISDKDRENPRMIEFIWFLLRIGAAATDIAASVKEHRESMVTSSRNVSLKKLLRRSGRMGCVERM